jgi:hypothetical protein
MRMSDTERRTVIATTRTLSRAAVDVNHSIRVTRITYIDRCCYIREHVATMRFAHTLIRVTNHRDQRQYSRSPPIGSTGATI